MFIHRGESFGAGVSHKKRSPRVPDIIIREDYVGYEPVPCIQVTQGNAICCAFSPVSLQLMQQKLKPSVCVRERQREREERYRERKRERESKGERERERTCRELHFSPTHKWIS
ncbi:hypothetical protein FHG87_004865 [Trinorchestia longiramus]|nr:hypothetical protein FHG87_004865 [Trinorchestia longiramus]